MQIIFELYELEVGKEIHYENLLNLTGILSTCYICLLTYYDWNIMSNGLISCHLLNSTQKSKLFLTLYYIFYNFYFLLLVHLSYEKNMCSIRARCCLFFSPLIPRTWNCAWHLEDMRTN